MFSEDKTVSGDQAGAPTAFTIEASKENIAKPKAKTVSKTKQKLAVSKMAAALQKMKLEPEAAFELADKDKSGSVDIPELGRCFKAIRIGDAMTLRTVFDTNHDGSLSKEEFLAVFAEAKATK